VHFSEAFKAEAALKEIRDNKTTADLAAELGIHGNRFMGCSNAFLE